MDGAQPTFELIANGKYPLSRPLFFYVKKAHAGVIPGVKEYLAEFTSEKAWGKDGYLSEKGLIPLPDAERKQVAENVKAMKTLDRGEISLAYFSKVRPEAVVGLTCFEANLYLSDALSKILGGETCSH